MRKKSILFSIIPALIGSAQAEEGMWTFDHLPIRQMKQQYGFEPSVEWINHVIQSSARLAEGCSASFVSGDGLVMTNHHCANTCLTDLSDKNHDYFHDGFSALEVSKEPQCPGMELDRLDQVKDVTGRVAEMTAGKHGAEYAKALQVANSVLTKECAVGDASHWRCDVVTLYHGGQTALYRYRRYQDIRLVMAPDQDIAFFGGDPDNFTFPRYDIDLSMLRVFEDGKPVHTPFFKFDPKGPKAGDLVFTSGNPGRTQRSLPASALAFQRDVSLPTIIAAYSTLEGALWQYSRESKTHLIDAQNTLFGVQNALKSLSGTAKALREPEVIEKREAEDQALQAWIDADAERRKTYGDPYKKVEAVLAVQRQYYVHDFAITRTVHGLLGDAVMLVSAAHERKKPDTERRAGYHDAELAALETEIAAKVPVHTELETTTLALGMTTMRQILGEDDAAVHLILGTKSPDERAVELIQGTKLADPAERLALYKGGVKAIEASKDPMIVLARHLQPVLDTIRNRSRDQIEAPMHEAQGTIARAQFARAQTEGKADTLYPDATFSPRLSYGTVKGFQDGAKVIAPFTDFAGMYKHATGSDPFRLPQVWLDAKPHLNLSTKLDYVSTNDIVGGNSGSPVINRQGDVVGLIFDGNLDSLAGDLYYDIERNRAVSTDTSAIMAALRTVYHADALADELETGKLKSRPE
ncbi:S46 family peptidase [Gluconobacter kondonii]|nr:S46 family peptidase [Gluconobacter kondonii]MBN3868112.1 S46 family peptidase [Gluconobacter kondonii]